MDQENQIQQPAPVSPNPGTFETPEKGTKKSGKVLPLILILVALAGVGFGIYGMFLGPKPTTPTCPTCVSENTEKPGEQTPQETPEPTEQKAEGPFLATSRFKNLNTEQQSHFYDPWGRSLKGIFFNDTDMENHNEFTLDYYDDDSKTQGWQIVSTDHTTKYSISFTSEQPVDAFAGMFGHDAGGTRILFLMNDGSVEYINPFDPVIEGNTIKTNGKIDGLSDIVRLHQTGISTSTVGGGLTVVAEDKDGYYYDLHLLIK